MVSTIFPEYAAPVPSSAVNMTVIHTPGVRARSFSSPAAPTTTTTTMATPADAHASPPSFHRRRGSDPPSDPARDWRVPSETAPTWTAAAALNAIAGGQSERFSSPTTIAFAVALEAAIMDEAAAALAAVAVSKPAGEEEGKGEAKETEKKKKRTNRRIKRYRLPKKRDGGGDGGAKPEGGGDSIAAGA